MKKAGTVTRKGKGGKETRNAEALIDWIMGGRELDGEEEKTIARIVALRDSLARIDGDEAEAGWEKLVEEEATLRVRIQQATTSPAFIAEAGDLLDALDGNSEGLLLEVEAIYNLGLVGAFARIGAGEDASAVWEDLQSGHIFNLTPVYWNRVKMRTERFSRWNPEMGVLDGPSPALLAEFGIIVGLFGWLCGKPAGGTQKNDFWKWMANAIPGWVDDARGEALWMDEESGEWTLAETAEGMSGETRRKLAIGLAAYCAHLGEGAKGEIRMCAQRAYAEGEMAYVKASLEDAKAAELTAEAQVAELESRLVDKDKALAEAEAHRAEAERKREKAEEAEAKGKRVEDWLAHIDARIGAVVLEVKTEGQATREQAAQYHSETMMAVKCLVDKDKREKDFVAACVEFRRETGDAPPRGGIAKAHAKDWLPDARKRYDLGNTKSPSRWLDRYSEWFYDLGKPGTLEDYRAKRKTMKARK